MKTHGKPFEHPLADDLDTFSELQGTTILVSNGRCYMLAEGVRLDAPFPFEL